MNKSNSGFLNRFFRKKVSSIEHEDQKICDVCGKNNLIEANFCPHCGSDFQIIYESYDAFISYRRESGSDLASLVRSELGKRFNKKVFLDVKELQVGRFDEKLLKEIEEAPNFILILSPGCLNRCVDKSDWLKREIMHAIKTYRNIIPVMKEDFKFPPNEQWKLFPSEMEIIKSHNAAHYSHLHLGDSILTIAKFMKKEEDLKKHSSIENKKGNYKKEKEIKEQKPVSTEKSNSWEQDNDHITNIKSVSNSNIEVKHEIKNHTDDSLKKATIIHKTPESNSEQILQMQDSCEKVKWLFSNKYVFIEIDSNSFKKLVVDGEIIGATKPLKRNLIYVLTYYNGTSFLLEFNLNSKLLVNTIKLPTVIKTRERNWGDKIIAATSDGEKVAMVKGFQQGIFLYNIKTQEAEVIKSGSHTNYIAIDKNDEYYYLCYDNENIQKIDVRSGGKKILHLFNTGLSVPISNNRAIFAAYEGKLTVYDFNKNEEIKWGKTGFGDKNSMKISDDEKTLYTLNIERSEIHSTNLEKPNEVKTYKLSDKGRVVYSMYLDDNDSVYVAFGDECTLIMIEGGLSNPRTTHIEIVEEKESEKINSIIENSSKKAILNNCYGYIVNSIYDIIPFDEIGSFDDCSGKIIEVSEKPYDLDFIKETKVEIDFNAIKQIDFISDFSEIEKYSWHLYPKQKVNETYQRFIFNMENNEEYNFHKKLFDSKNRLFLPKLFHFKKDGFLKRIESNDIKRIVFNTNEKNTKNIGVQISGAFTYVNDKQVSFTSIFPDSFKKDGNICFINGTSLDDDSLPQEISYPLKSIKKIVISKENFAFSKTDMDGKTFSIEYKKIDVSLNNEDQFSHYIVANQSISVPTVIKGNNTKTLSFFAPGIKREVDICALKEIVFFNHDVADVSIKVQTKDNNGCISFQFEKTINGLANLGFLTSVLYLKEKNLLIIGNQKKLNFVRNGSFEVISSDMAHTQNIDAICHDQNTNTILSCGKDKIIRWDLDSKSPIEIIYNFENLKRHNGRIYGFFNDSKYLAFSDFYEKSISLYDIEKNELINNIGKQYLKSSPGAAMLDNQSSRMIFEDKDTNQIITLTFPGLEKKITPLMLETGHVGLLKDMPELNGFISYTPHAEMINIWSYEGRKLASYELRIKNRGGQIKKVVDIVKITDGKIMFFYNTGLVDIYNLKA